VRHGLRVSQAEHSLMKVKELIELDDLSTAVRLVNQAIGKAAISKAAISKAAIEETAKILRDPEARR
jgi:hypothetical protein